MLLLNERPLYIFITKRKGPVERGKLKMEEVEVGDGRIFILRPGHGLESLQGRDRKPRLQLLTPLFSAK